MGGSGAGKTNELLNLINNQQEIDKNISVCKRPL